MRRPNELSLRARLLLVSVFALTAGLAVGGVLLVGALNFAALRAINSEALDTAKAVFQVHGVDAGPGAVVPAAVPSKRPVRFTISFSLGLRVDRPLSGAPIDDGHPGR